MNQDDKRKLENQLLVMGLKGLTDPQLIQQLADIVSDWPGDRDQFFQDLLNECDAAKRSEMYNAMAPKLRFKPRSLVEYETSIQMRASELVSQGRMRVEGESPSPITVGDQQFAQVRPEHATHVVLSLVCHRCTRHEKFVDQTPVSAMVKARKAGWRRELTISKEICPKCVKKAQKQVLMKAGNA